MISWCWRAISTISRSNASGYSAPVGLFGLMMTMARVFGVILLRMSARSGIQSVCSSQR